MRAILQSPTLQRLATLAARAILSCVAVVPLLASAQTVTAWNVQSIYTHSKQLNELAEANMWTDGTTNLRELQRNATSVQLQSIDKTKSYLIDFSRNAVFADLNGASAPDPFVRTGTASGFTVAFLKLVVVTPSNRPFADVRAEEIRRDGISQGWTITPTFRNLFGTTPLSHSDLSYISGWRNAYGTAFTAKPDTVSRTAAAITIPLSPDATKGKATIDPTTKWGTQGTWAEFVAPVTGKNVGSMTVAIRMSLDPTKINVQSHPMTLVQNSPTKWRLNLANQPDQGTSWTEVGRTVDYIDLKDDGAPHVWRFWMSGQIQSKQAGAADSTYYTINSSSVGSLYAVLNTALQWPGQIGTVWQNPPPGTSPGFQIVNKTDSPVLISLEQAGCLYYGVVQPGQVFQRDTGAVWFTIRASMAPKPEEPTVWNCVRDPLMYAATVLAVGAVTVGTGGTGTAFVLPAMMATAAGMGASFATEAAVQAAGGTQFQAVGSGVGVALLTKAGVPAGLAFITGGPLAAANAAATTLLDPKLILGTTATLVGEHYSIKWARSDAIGDITVNQIKQIQGETQAEINAVKQQMVQETVVAGAYAGYPWPWPMSKRVMPKYEIVGGPRIRKTETGVTMILEQERPLALVRVN
jgi:hypothetical protein